MARRAFPFRAVRSGHCLPALFIICLSILVSFAGCTTTPEDVGPPAEPAEAEEPAADEMAAEAAEDADGAAELEEPGDEGAEPPEPLRAVADDGRHV